MFSLTPRLKGRAPVCNDLGLDEPINWRLKVEWDDRAGKVFRLFEVLNPENDLEIGRVTYSLERGAIGFAELRLPLVRAHDAHAKLPCFRQERRNVAR